MIDLLIILSMGIGSLLGLYSIFKVYEAMKFFRFQKIWMVMGLGFISNTIIFIFILLLYIFGLLEEIGWVMFIHPASFGIISIWAVYTLRRKLHAS